MPTRGEERRRDAARSPDAGRTPRSGDGVRRDRGPAVWLLGLLLLISGPSPLGWVVGWEGVSTAAADEPAPAPLPPLAPPAPPPAPTAPLPPPPAPGTSGDPAPAPGPTETESAASPWVLYRGPARVEDVVDGDTLRIPGQRSVRIRAIDTEEVFRKPEDRAAALADFDAYARAQRGDAPRPVKYGTPHGEAARERLRALVAQATHVRLERDREGGQVKDTFGRTLAHVILECPQKEIHVAETLIREGFSPYFVKYGRSARFDTALRAAETQARERARGIWNPEIPGHYPDYVERLRWWHERADQVSAWHAQADVPERVTLGTEGTTAALEARVGKTTTVFGLVSRTTVTRDGRRWIVFLGDQPKKPFALVFFAEDVRHTLDEDALTTRFVRATGTLTRYRGRPQMVIERADQISTE